MPTYRQYSTYHEDSFGETSILFVISDSYDGLFEVDDTVATDVFLLGSFKSDLDLSKGELAQDELSFTVNEASATTADDEDAIAFYKEAQDPAIQRFCAVFLNCDDLPTVPDVELAVFIGRVFPDTKGQDLRHYGSTWSTAINPLREWSSRAGTFMDEVVDTIPLYDLIYGNDADLVTGIGSDWESTNVSDRLVWHKSAGGDPYGAREARFESVVSLNLLLRKIADNVVQTLDDKGLGTYNINLLPSTIDWQLSPARYNVQRSKEGSWKGRHLKPNNEGGPYRIDDNDKVTLGLGDGQAEGNQIWCHYQMAKPVTKTERDVSFLRCKSFTDLLYGIARTFGLYVHFFQPNSTDINILFKSRSAVEQVEVFFAGAASGEVNLSVMGSADEQARVSATSTQFTVDGPDSYTIDNIEDSGTGVIPSKKLHKRRDGEQTLLTVAPTLVQFSAGEDAGWKWYYHYLPHNGVLYSGGSRETGAAYKGAVGAYNGIFVRTVVTTEKVTPDTDPIWLQAALVHANIDGEDKTYESLTEYVNDLLVRDGQYFKAEYSLEIPYLNAFSLSDDGSAPSWKNLQLGSKITLQEQEVDKEYLVVGVERMLSEIKTRIRLHNISRMAFSSPGDIPSPIYVTMDDDSAGKAETPEAGIPRNYTADEDISEGDAICLFDVGGTTYGRRATAYETDCGNISGIALADCPVTAIGNYRSTGVITSSNFSFTVGEPVYVRTSEYPAINISQNILKAPTDTENMVVKIGHASQSNELAINIFTQRIFRSETCSG